VPQTLCNRAFYLTWLGNLGTLTFTNTRPKSEKLFASGEVDDVNIFRAHITTTIENLVALRDLFAGSIKTSKTGAPTPVPTKY